MHRRRLLELVRGYGAAHPDERARVDRFLSFVETHPDCLLRSCAPGHVTAAAWIVSVDGERFLLSHHRKLGKWLQLGGHVDGEPDPLRAALREAREESGMSRFAVLGGGLPLDLDVHRIPARPGEPAHLHFDVRFLLRAEPGQALAVSEESKELRWFPAAKAERWLVEESVLRMARKASRWLESGG